MHNYECTDIGPLQCCILPEHSEVTDTIAATLPVTNLWLKEALLLYLGWRPGCNPPWSMKDLHYWHCCIYTETFLFQQRLSTVFVKQGVILSCNTLFCSIHFLQFLELHNLHCLLNMFRHYQLTNHAKYVANEAFKHYILLRSSAFVYFPTPLSSSPSLPTRKLVSWSYPVMKTAWS